MKLPENIQVALGFEGMTSERGLLLMDTFLNKAMKLHPDGLCFEFGTYKGRSAALIAGRMSETNWLHAIEPKDYLEFEKLKNISSNVTWHKSKSEQFCQNELARVVGTDLVTFSHHDASHFFDNVTTELSSIVNVMHPHGIIVLDDFNDAFSQVRAAYYHLRYVCEFPYELLLVGFNKAILVHQDQFDYYEDYVLNELLDELEQIEFTCRLCRTDINPLSRSFFLQYRLDPDAGRLYGTDFFGETFYQPSREYLAKNANKTLKDSQ